MSKVIHAKAVISAEDKTGGVFDALAKKFKGVEKAAKDLGGIKAPKFFGDYSGELARLKATEKELQQIRKGFQQFDAALKSGGPMRAGKYFDAIKMWEAKTIDSLRKVRAKYGEVDQVQNRFFQRAGRHMATVAGIGTAGYVGNRIARAGITASATSQRESARDYLAGMSDEDSKRIAREALRQSASYPSVDSSTMHERLRDTSMGMRSTDKAIELGETIAQGTTVLQSLKGKDKAIEEGRKFFSALDVMGKNVDPKEVRELFHGYVKALGVEGADMDLGGVLQMAKQSRAAGGILSNRFLMTTAPGLGRDLGDHQLGTSLASALSQNIGGRATKTSQAEQQAYGLRDKKGQFLDSRLAMTDPDKYAWERLIPALQKKGVNPDDDVGVAASMSKLFSNRTVADVFTKLISQREQYQAKAKQYDKAPGLEGAKPLLTKDTFVGYEAVLAQLRNFAAEVSKPAFKEGGPVAQGLASLALGIGNISQNYAGSSTREKLSMGVAGGIAGGAAIGAGVMALKGAYQWFTGGGAALNASATALTGSAAALTAAAARLAAGATIAQVTGATAAAASGAAATGGAAAAGAASGGAGSALWGAGAAALPWLGAGATVGAGMLGLRAAVDSKGWAGKTSGERMRESRGGKSVRQMLRDQWGDTSSSPEISPTMTYGTGASGDRSAGSGGGNIDVTGTVEGEATMTLKVEAGSSLLQVVQQAQQVVKLAGQLQGNGPGSLGRSSPDAASPSDVGKRGGM